MKSRKYLFEKNNCGFRKFLTCYKFTCYTLLLKSRIVQGKIPLLSGYKRVLITNKVPR